MESLQSFFTGYPAKHNLSTTAQSGLHSVQLLPSPNTQYPHATMMPMTTHPSNITNNVPLLQPLDLSRYTPIKYTTDHKLNINCPLKPTTPTSYLQPRVSSARNTDQKSRQPDNHDTSRYSSTHSTPQVQPLPVDSTDPQGTYATPAAYPQSVQPWSGQRPREGRVENGRDHDDVGRVGMESLPNLDLMGLSGMGGLGGINYPRMMEWNGYMQPHQNHPYQAQTHRTSHSVPIFEPLNIQPLLNHVRTASYPALPLQPPCNHFQSHINTGNAHYTTHPIQTSPPYADESQSMGHFGFDTVGDWAENVAMVDGEEMGMDMGNMIGGARDKKRRHICVVCNKAFSRPSSLNTHMSVHTGAKPYSCRVGGCSRKFSVSSNLRRHERTHTTRKALPLPSKNRFEYHSALPAIRSPHRTHSGQSPQFINLTPKDYSLTLNPTSLEYHTHHYPNLPPLSTVAPEIDYSKDRSDGDDDGIEVSSWDVGDLRRYQCVSAARRDERKDDEIEKPRTRGSGLKGPDCHGPTSGGGFKGKADSSSSYADGEEQERGSMVSEEDMDDGVITPEQAILRGRGGFSHERGKGVERSGS